MRRWRDSLSCIHEDRSAGPLPTSDELTDPCKPATPDALLRTDPVLRSRCTLDDRAPTCSPGVPAKLIPRGLSAPRRAPARGLPDAYWRAYDVADELARCSA
jgi:hypothetical protein